MRLTRNLLLAIGCVVCGCAPAVGPGTVPLDIAMNQFKDVPAGTTVKSVMVHAPAWIFVVQNHRITFKSEVVGGSFPREVPISVIDDGTHQEIYIAVMDDDVGGEQVLIGKNCFNSGDRNCRLCMVCMGCCLPPPLTPTPTPTP
jgi:hypothetical protein